MLWKRNKKKQPEGPTTFKERVEEFWEWFSGVAPRFFETIEDGRCADLQPEVSEATEKLLPGGGWVFGPGPEEKGGHSFTLTAEGIIHRQFLTEYWKVRAPDLDGWTFYSSRQPGSIHDKMSIKVEEDDFEFGALWVTPTVNEENENVTITAWHPLFEKVDTQRKDTVLYLILDEVLGEYGTEQWLGTIETSDQELAGAIPVSELRDFLLDLEIERGWKKYPPTESWSTYQLPAPDDRFLRSDTVAGTTADMSLIGDFLESEGDLEDPIAGTGADFLFVAFPSDILPAGEEVKFRGEIEDLLDGRLTRSASGRIIGGALGKGTAYIDLLIFDGRRSLDLIREVLVEKGLPSGTGIHFFARGNEGRRIIL